MLPLVGLIRRRFALSVKTGRTDGWRHLLFADGQKTAEEKKNPLRPPLTPGYHLSRSHAANVNGRYPSLRNEGEAKWNKREPKGSSPE